jgi:hypothetical protein
LRLDETPVFSRVRVTAVGSLSTSESDSNLLGAAVITWTSLEPSDDAFAEVDVRGVLISGSELHWMAGDTEVEMIELPHYAGMPEDLVLQAAHLPLLTLSEQGQICMHTAGSRRHPAMVLLPTPQWRPCARVVVGIDQVLVTVVQGPADHAHNLPTVTDICSPQ